VSRVAGNTLEKSNGIQWPDAEVIAQDITIIPKPVAVPTDNTLVERLPYTGNEQVSYGNVSEDAEYTVKTPAKGTNVTNTPIQGTLEIKPGYCWKVEGEDKNATLTYTVDDQLVNLLLIVNADGDWEQLPKIKNDPVPYGDEADIENGVVSNSTGEEPTVKFYKAEDFDLEKNQPKSGKDDAYTTTTTTLDPGDYVAYFVVETTDGHDDATTAIPFKVAEPDYQVYISRQYILGYTMIYVFSQNSTTKFSYTKDSNADGSTDNGKRFEMYDITALGYTLYLNEKGEVGSLTQDDTYTTLYKAVKVYAYMVKINEYQNKATNIVRSNEARDTNKVVGLSNGPMDVNTNGKINLTDASNVSDVVLLSASVPLIKQLNEDGGTKDTNVNWSVVFRADVNRDGYVRTVDDADPIIQTYLANPIDD
jgi:hypothetical protein